jgi:hypothetical protein
MITITLFLHWLLGINHPCAKIISHEEGPSE